ncbi:Serine/threonine protein kinase [Thermomonospora echinospora]|uniref:non-specific serine/threonine protein kinase n=1 Tax=Thermomonospora echinospora TaxID=1992 RepID=A0A1H5X1B6_9ACTN|nr:serine/threonine-protein kinase [Thermomonospora echinospora]SEG05592.1 Serine/threonine protein kinase [Thermomonospora echinospora]
MTEDVPGYHVLEKVGEGGFSVVYRAYQERLDRQVALKVLSVNAVDSAAMKRFQRECKITGRLSGHPNVVTVLDTGSTRSGRPYIAMEYFERGALTDRIAREGPLPVPEVLRIGVKTAGALAATHETGVLHRDIKPQNILVSRYGEPALADFGIARLVDSFDATHTQAFTPQHAAPEILEGRPPGVPSDIYSLGSTLYQLLAGTPAFQGHPGEGIAPFVLRILHEPPPAIRRDDIPPQVFETICTAMAKAPEQRFPSAVAFAQRLQRLQGELGLPVTELAHGSVEVSEIGSFTTDEAPSLPPAPYPPPGIPNGPAFPGTPEGSASWQGVGGGPPPPHWTSADGAPAHPVHAGQALPAPAPHRMPAPLAVHAHAQQGVVTAPLPPEPAPPRGLPRGLVIAGAVALVGGIAGGIAAFGAFGGDGGASPQTGTSSTASTAAATSPPPQDQEAPPIPQAQIRRAAPLHVRLVSDQRTSVNLRWRLPAVSRRLPILVQRAPADGRPLISAGNGATAAAVDGLRPGTGYCFRVGAMLRSATAADPQPVIAWSKPLCIRGARTRTG